MKIILFFMVLFTVNISAFGGDSGYANISGIRYNDTLAVRSGPSTRYIRVGDLAPDANDVRVMKCTYNDRGSKWCKIRYGRLVGWSSARYLRATGASNYAQSSGWVARVIHIRYDDTLAMREGPSTRYYKIGDIPPYAKNVYVQRCVRNNRGSRWCKVRYNGRLGWSSARYLRAR